MASPSWGLPFCSANLAAGSRNMQLIGIFRFFVILIIIFHDLGKNQISVSKWIQTHYCEHPQKPLEIRHFAAVACFLWQKWLLSNGRIRITYVTDVKGVHLITVISLSGAIVKGVSNQKWRRQDVESRRRHGLIRCRVCTACRSSSPGRGSSRCCALCRSASARCPPRSGRNTP